MCRRLIILYHLITVCTSYIHNTEFNEEDIGRTLRNSASKFLLEVYNELSYEDTIVEHHRNKRSLNIEDNFITDLDRVTIEKCNNIITFSGKDTQHYTDTYHQSFRTIGTNMYITFNTNDVPSDLRLEHAFLRIYQDPSLGHYNELPTTQFTISIYQRIHNRKNQTSNFKILTSVNTTSTYKGWLELNITRTLNKWLQFKTLHHVIHGQELKVSVLLHTNGTRPTPVRPTDIGLISARSDVTGRQPFMIGYFNGPELTAKIQTLRFKREVIKRKRKADLHHHQSSSHNPEIYKLPKSCERHNFTVDFKDLHMHNWVIAPKKFEAYFCGGECNFPLASKMNATNHAIVQTLMHLKQPNLPKPCCVPTVLGSISILHYLNEDSVHLSKYPQSVVKECGCH